MTENMISIIVPVYNAGPYIHRCIDSVKAQTYKNWELILIDDGSNDDSGRIIDECASDDSRIKVFHQANGGASSARNKGLQNATGAFLTFLDADDYLYENALEDLMSVQRHDDFDLVIGDFEYKINGEVFQYHHPQCKETVGFIQDFLASSWVIIWGSLIRSSLFHDNNICFPEGVVYSEDFYTILRILLVSQRIGNCHVRVYHYNRDNEASVTHIDDTRKTLNERDIYLKCLLFLNGNGLIERYETPLAWRLLKIEQALIYNREYFEEFRDNYPRKARYISSCPFISIKMKAMMWFVAKKCESCARLLLKLREKI